MSAEVGCLIFTKANSGKAVVQPYAGDSNFLTADSEKRTQGDLHRTRFEQLSVSKSTMDV